MSDVIDLAKERARRTEPQPDAEHVYEDEQGVTWRKFDFVFTCDGVESVYDIWAVDIDDARRRLKLIGETGEVRGQVFATGWVPL